VIWTFASGDAKKAYKARQQFVETLKISADPAQDFYSAEIIFGELVGNVVRHAPGPIQIRLDWLEDVPVLTVHDQGEGFTIDPSLPGDMSEGGRGLFIVSQLAQDVSVNKIPGDGHAVRVTLPMKRCITGPIEAVS